MTNHDLSLSMEGWWSRVGVVLTHNPARFFLSRVLVYVSFFFAYCFCRLLLCEAPRLYRSDFRLSPD
jgi:hypothetical protein